ncbi:MAG: acetyl-CoA C-acyltransferase [Crocinitomicaceae bacterium]|nr:acetyl-CoA C-acyltransferase [Crocinitomicaceae bacterium]
MKTAYIVGGYRSAVGKSGKGVFRFTRPDEMGKQVVQHLLKDFPELDTERIDDIIVGNATPEAEQGLNLARMISLMGLNTDKVPGMTINRYCSSGLQSIALAKYQIESGAANCIIAGGVECMSPIPFGGWRIVPHHKVSKENPEWYWGMGLTAEAVAEKFKISRASQDEFALNSHIKAISAIEQGKFEKEIAPIEINHIFLDENEKKHERKYFANVDEGPRKNSTIEALNKLRPVFKNGGTVTAGNSSQTSDGAAFVMVMSEDMVKELNIKPIARLISYKVVGLDPKIMGVGPLYAIPEALKLAGMKLKDLEQIELNEAFASQSVAIIKELGLDPSIVNVNGGAIALGHPLGCTGSKLSIQLFNEMRRRKQKIGAVTMCVGTGQGACGIFELLN